MQGTVRRNRLRGKALPSHTTKSEAETPSLEAMATELYAVIHRALKGFGVTERQQRTAIEAARRQKTLPRAYGKLRQLTHQLGSLISHWNSDAEYTDLNGRARTLTIEGPGATFETLVQKFMPRTPLSDAVKLACERAEVATRPGGRIALLGNILVKVIKSNSSSLAYTIQHIDQLLSTMQYNRRFASDRGGLGWPDRMVNVAIPERTFTDVVKALRPQIADLCFRAESLLVQASSRRKGPKEKMAAVALGIYLSREDDLRRAGFSPR